MKKSLSEREAAQIEIGEVVKVHYRNRQLCRVQSSLSNILYRTLGKAFAKCKLVFAECP